MASPTLEQQKTLAALAERLGIPVPRPESDVEAGFIIDDLRWKERKSRRDN